jgi:hypothetical protein
LKDLKDVISTLLYHPIILKDIKKGAKEQKKRDEIIRSLSKEYIRFKMETMKTLEFTNYLNNYEPN